MSAGPTPLHRARMDRFVEAGLYLVTSEALSAGRGTPEIVRAALDAGVRLVQLREKELAGRDLFKMAEEVRALTADAGALMLVNDRLDVALAAARTVCIWARGTCRLRRHGPSPRI